MKTAGPWMVWRLAPESDPEQRNIITTADGKQEITGVIYNDDDAPLIAAAPELFDMLKKVKEEFFDSGIIDLPEFKAEIETILNKIN